MANADKGISEEEIKMFEKFFGKGEFSKEFNIDRILETLPDRIEIANEHTSLSQRMQVMRDICVMSRADGKANEAEHAVMDDIADQLGISRAFILQTLDQDCEPD